MTKEKSKTDSLIKGITDILSKNGKKSYNYKQISEILCIKSRQERQEINNLLKDLAAKKILKEISHGKYKKNIEFIEKVTAQNSYITGKVDMKSTGKAYIISDTLDEDIYIAPNNTKHALHGDIVKVLLFPVRKNRKQEGQIVEVIKQSKTQFTGIVRLSKHFAFLNPGSSTMPVDIYIPLECLNGAKEGQKAIARIIEWPERTKNPIGEIIRVLGYPGNNDVEISSILAEFELPVEFPEEVNDEAKKIKKTINKSEIKNRRDYRDITTFTIDPEDAKDFDDALSVKKIDDNKWEIGVHIADVSHYVKEGSVLDKNAFNRATSIYLVDRVIPMLPENISNDICSLKPNVDRLCFSAVFEMDNKANIISEWFGKTVIHSDRRFTYQEVQKIIEQQDGEFLEEINTLNKLAKILRDERFKKGSIAFERGEVKFKLDKSGKPIDVFFKEMKDSNKLIEDFMLLANRKVAELIGRSKTPRKHEAMVYRVHDEPTKEKLLEFSRFVAKFGYKMKINSRQNIAKSFNDLFEQIEGKGEENMIQTLSIRTMEKAYYTVKNKGHYGLAFDFYTHFTSPIRRYPDLIVHRLLYLYLNNETFPTTQKVELQCKYSSEMEKKAAEAERTSIKFKQVEFMKERVGQEFDGHISGVSKWGIFVEIEENKCEGMVRLNDIKEDLYYLDDENYCVIGQKYGNKYKLGDKVRIIVKNANIEKRQLDFLFSES
ncbi:MAG: ribonuclease R [Bacteroidota bacterium]|nr:ribonuclease R [Bacteroidota bacterium]